MKIAIINFSGNVGKTTVARQLLAPRMDAPAFTIETINAGVGDEHDNAERMKGKEFGALQRELTMLDSAIVDVGSSNVEEFLRLMAQFEDSHEEFDQYVVPIVPERKQQTDSLATIKVLATLGVPSHKIRMIFNKVELDDMGQLPLLFGAIFAYHARLSSFTLNPEAVIYKSEAFERSRAVGKTVAALAADETDYRDIARKATDETTRERALSLRLAQMLCRSAHRNLDTAYAALFA